MLLYLYVENKKIIDIKNPGKDTMDALMHLDLPSGVGILIKQ